MRVQELRIGNLFIESISNQIIEVIGLEKEKIKFTGIFVGKWQSKPIPLTKEWLIKFGWEYNPISNEYHGNGMILHNHSSYISWGVIKLYYVHKLQNLYFELKDEELIYKL